MGRYVPCADEYRKMAKVCIAQAELIRDPQERAAMLAIAGAYLKMSEHISARHHRGADDRAQGDQDSENNTLPTEVARADAVPYASSPAHRPTSAGHISIPTSPRPPAELHSFTADLAANAIAALGYY